MLQGRKLSQVEVDKVDQGRQGGMGGLGSDSNPGRLSPQSLLRLCLKGYSVLSSSGASLPVEFVIKIW